MLGVAMIYCATEPQINRIGKELYFYVFTVREGRVRAISLRPASQKEKERYGKSKK